MKRLIIFLLLFAAIKVAGQTTGYLRFDTVLIYKQGGTAELILRSSTKDTLGGLFNYGNGKTRFMRSRAINDSTIVIGLDTIVIRGATGGSSSTDTTYTEKPIYVKTGTDDTLALLIDPTGGLDTNPSDTSLRIADLGVTTARIDNLAVTTGKIADGAVTTIKIADNNVTTAKILDANVTDAKISNRTARSVMGRAPNSVGVAADIASATANRVLTDDGSTLAFRQVDLTTMVTGALPEDNIAAFRTYPAERTNEVILYEKAAWTPAEFGAEFSRGANHTLTLNGSFPRIASSTIVWGGASVTRFLPQNPIIAIYDKIEMDYQIVTPNVGFGLTMQSNNVNGANFGYTTYYGNGASPGTTNLGKQDGTNTQTGTSIAWTTNDVIRQTMEFRDTALVVTFQNLTTSSAVSTITKSFLAGTAPYPPNTGTWGFQNFSGTYEIRRIKITSRKVISPTLMIAFDSKGQIITTSWNARFPTLLNARYPTVLNYSGGGDQLKDLIDKRVEFNKLNPEQVLIGLGSNDLRYGSSLATTLDRLDKVVKMVSGSTTRWAVTVVPEDSTAGGLSGLTALKNAMVALYPSNYVDLWTFMSTSNVLKAAYNSGDGIHPNTDGHRVIDSLIAVSGFFSVQSVNRRTPYQKIGGGLIAIGDSLTDVFKKPFAPNSILKFNDSNQVVGTQMFETGNRIYISQNFPHVQSVTATTLFQMDGLQSYTGTSGGNVFYDRTNTTNFHTLYSNNNQFRLGYNGTDNIFVDAIGTMGFGTINSGFPMSPTLYTRKDRTVLAGSTDSRGINIVADTMTVTMAAGMSTNFYGSKIARMTMAAPSAHGATRPINFVVEGLLEGTNVEFVNPYAFGVLKGRSYFDSTINLNNIATGDSDDSVLVVAGGGDVKRIAQSDLSGGSGITSINSETGPGITIAAGTGISVNTTTNTVTVSAATPNYELMFSDLSTTTVANTVTQTTLYGSGAGTAQFSSITAGSVLSLKGSGTISTDATPGVPQFSFTTGTFTLGTNLTGLTGGLTNVVYDYEYTVVPHGTGASQDIFYSLVIHVYETATTIRTYAVSASQAAGFTTTGTPAANVQVEWDTADADNSVVARKNVVEIYRK